MKLRPVAALLVCLFFTACAPQYLRSERHYQDEPGFVIDKEAEIADTTENRQILDVLLQYRSAVVRKDVGTLKRLVSARYYDNAATTDTTRDDYGADDLNEVFEMMAQHTDQIRYDVTVKAVEVQRNVAWIDYEFRYAYEYSVGDAPTWDAGIDVNRLQLEAEDGEWKIVSGL